MNILDLPDEVLVNIFDNYVNRIQLEALHSTCKRFRLLIDHYDHLWLKYLFELPAIDYSYPFGFSQFNQHPNGVSNSHRIRTASKYASNQNKKKVFYSFSSKMLPHLQIDMSSHDPTLFVTDASSLVEMKLDDIKDYAPSKLHRSRILQEKETYRKQKLANVNPIKLVSRREIFNDDIKSFTKKDDYLVSISNNRLSVDCFVERSRPENVFELEEYAYGNKINCVDFSTQNSKLVYGCSDGHIKVHDIRKENSFNRLPIGIKNLNDRVLRVALSPSLQNLAIGTAGIRPTTSPMRVYDFGSLKEVQTLQPSNRIEYKKGAGILALSYIDENSLMSAGYDTFIRIFDLRSNKCVQELEEPEDMSVYCVCVSRFYGLLSGNNRQSMVRFWDRRQTKIISTFYASQNNSSVYSLACTPDTVYAAWDLGLTAIELSS